MINIKIDGQTAHKLNTPVIAADAVNFVFVRAQFSDDWAGLKKSYIFSNGAVAVQLESDEDTVAVPAEVLIPGSMTIGIKGVKLDEDGKAVAVRATHTALSYEILPSGVGGEAARAGDITPTEAEQLRDMLENCASEACKSPIRAGAGKNALEQISFPEARAVGDYTAALGKNTVAGRKSYYIKSVNAADKKIYLCKAQVKASFSSADNTDAEFTTPRYSVGDAFSIINGNNYEACGKIVSFSHNVITYSEDLPFSSFTSTPNADDYTFCVPSKPLIGTHSLGTAAFCVGEEVKTAGRGSIGGGRYNLAVGDYSFVAGMNNMVSYCSAAVGMGNTTHGKFNCTSGSNNFTNGDSNRVDGYRNTVNGLLNTVSGGENKVTGNLHDVSGQFNTVNGHRNTVRGRGNISSGWTQFVMGQFCVDDPNKLFVIGNGTSESDRKNVFSIDENGNVYAPNIALNDPYVYRFCSYREIERRISSSFNTTLSCYAKALKSVSSGVDPNIIRKFPTYVDGNVYPYIKMKYKIVVSSATTMESKIYYTTATQTSFSESKVAIFSATADNQWHDAVINMSTAWKDNSKNSDGKNHWDSAVTALRFDLPNSSSVGQTVYVEYIGLFHSLEEANSFE